MSSERIAQTGSPAPTRPIPRDAGATGDGGADRDREEVEELAPTRRLRPALQFLGYLRFYASAVRDPRLTPIVGAAMGVLLLGTLFYWRQEGWTLLDAFYFSVITLATVGYGDFTPRTTLGKLFTIGYVLVGVGLLGSFLSLLVHRATELARHHPLPDNETRGPARKKSRPPSEPPTG